MDSQEKPHFRLISLTGFYYLIIIIASIYLIEPKYVIRARYHHLRAVYYGQNRLTDGILFYDYINQIFPDRPKVLARIAMLNYEWGDYETATDAYQKLKTIKPGFFDSVLSSYGKKK